MDVHQPFDTAGEQGYLNLLQHILNYGYKVDKERTGTGTIVSPTPHQLFFPNVGTQFPLFTTKKVSFNMLAAEMLWFISGSTNTNDLERIGSPAMKKMWDKWADEDGELGPVYGKQWREWKARTESRPERVSIDQLHTAIHTIKNNSESRRIIVSAWNPADIEDMALPPCHMTYQFTCEPLNNKERANLFQDIREDWTYKARTPDEWEEVYNKKDVPKYKLHLHMLQRSCDMFLGVPFNVAQYALLLNMVAKVTNTIPGGFTWTGVNCHIYQNHIDAVKTQLSRDPKTLPLVTINRVQSERTIDNFILDDFHLQGYNPHPAIKAKVSV